MKYMSSFSFRYRRVSPRRVLEMGFALAFVLTVLFSAAAARYQAVCREICGDTLRLHILANSDTPGDQALKLQVRDAVLETVTTLTAGARTKQEAVAAVQAALPRLKAIAEQTVQGRQAVAVRLEQRAFDAKDYGNFRLPAGEYTALRIELGKAEGHNWFCVLYPALCVGSSEARYENPEENALVFGGYEVRFALLDAARTLTGSLLSHP